MDGNSEKNRTLPAVSRETLEAAIANTPFAQLVGARLTDYEFGRVELEVPFSERITQHHGLAHGAIVAFLADSASAWAAASVAGDVVTSEYKINLLAPARGPTLVGRGEVVKATSRQVVVRADVLSGSSEDLTLVATSLATIARIPRKV